MTTSRLARVAILAAGVGVALVAATGVASAATHPGAGAASSDTAGRYGVVPMLGSQSGQAIQPAAAADLVYHGGPISASPAVYLVFWGSQWSSDANGVQSYLTKFFRDRLPFFPFSEVGTDLLPTPIRVLDEELPVPTPAAVAPGRDSEEVLATVLGYSAERIAALRAAGALG